MNKLKSEITLTANAFGRASDTKDQVAIFAFKRSSFAKFFTAPLAFVFRFVIFPKQIFAAGAFKHKNARGPYRPRRFEVSKVLNAADDHLNAIVAIVH